MRSTVSNLVFIVPLALAIWAGPAVHAEEGVNYQIIQSEDGQIWRLDTRSGEIVMCQARNARMVCASSGEQIAATTNSAADLEAAELQAESAREAAKLARLEYIVGLFERLIELAQQSQANGH